MMTVCKVNDNYSQQKSSKEKAWLYCSEEKIVLFCDIFQWPNLNVIHFPFTGNNINILSVLLCMLCVIKFDNTCNITLGK